MSTRAGSWQPPGELAPSSTARGLGRAPTENVAPRSRRRKRKRVGGHRARRPHAIGFVRLAVHPYRDAAEFAPPPPSVGRLDPAPLAACAVAVACAFAVVWTFGLGLRAVAGVSASLALLGVAAEEVGGTR